MKTVEGLLAIQPVRRWPERFWEKVEKSDGCWMWTGAKDKDGYGQTAIGHHHLHAHRVAYELMVGPLPDELVTDHLCRTPSCVNPAHIEPVTVRENVLRGVSLAAANAVKTHCPQGHPLSGDNVFSVTGQRGRRCRTCHRKQIREGLRRFRARHGSSR